MTGQQGGCPWVRIWKELELSSWVETSSGSRETASSLFPVMPELAFSAWQRDSRYSGSAGVLFLVSLLNRDFPRGGRGGVGCNIVRAQCSVMCSRMLDVLCGKPHSLSLSSGSLRCRGRQASTFLCLEAGRWGLRGSRQGRGECADDHLHQHAGAQRQDPQLRGQPQGLRGGGSGRWGEQGQRCSRHQVQAGCFDSGHRLLRHEDWRGIWSSYELQISSETNWGDVKLNIYLFQRSDVLKPMILSVPLEDAWWNNSSNGRSSEAIHLGCSRRRTPRWPLHGQADHWQGHQGGPGVGQCAGGAERPWRNPIQIQPRGRGAPSRGWVLQNWPPSNSHTFLVLSQLIVPRQNHTI